MTKYKLFFGNITKEEAWINRIIAQGYRLKNVIPGRYKFEELTSSDNSKNSIPEEETSEAFLPLVRIDYRTFSSLENFTDYLTLFEDCGWHHIAGNRSEGIQYFEKVRSDCQGEIFSDSLSKANRYRRISNLQLGLFLTYLPLLIIYCCIGLFHLPSFSHWKDLYYTPGLWQMSGGKFLLAFLFETPFAIGRSMGGFGPFLLFLLILYFGFLGFSALYRYWKEKKQ